MTRLRVWLARKLCPRPGWQVVEYTYYRRPLKCPQCGGSGWESRAGQEPGACGFCGGYGEAFG